MKHETTIDWNNFTPHTRIEESQGKRMIPTFQPHPDWGYQWKPVSKIAKKGKQLCNQAIESTRTRHCW